jgi:hypothetical protein
VPASSKVPVPCRASAAAGEKFSIRCARAIRAAFTIRFLFQTTFGYADTPGKFPLKLTALTARIQREWRVELPWEG